MVIDTTKFNSEGQMLESVLCHWDDVSKKALPQTQHIYEYDSEGVLKFETSIDFNDSNDSDKYEITKSNGQGFPIEKQRLEGNVVSRVWLNYNAKGKLISIDSYDQDILVCQDTFKYDANLDVLSSLTKFLGPEGEDDLVYETVYKYLDFDDRKNWIKRTIIPPGKKSEFSYVEERKIEYF